MSACRIGIIGGTGLYALPGLEDTRSLKVDTPFGQPSSEILCGKHGAVELCFIARHGEGHRLLPTEVPYQANIYALKQLGVTWCLSVAAVGSLREELAPGHAVVPDQFIDRTHGRNNTFFGNGIAAHVSFADPFCPVLRKALFEAAKTTSEGKDLSVHSSGTYLNMEGPAFSTRAESTLYRSWGADIIGMTNITEARLAREAEMAYATLALVTDYDCWRSETADVDINEILAILKANTAYAVEVITALTETLPGLEPSELVTKALQFAIVSDKSKIAEDRAAELEAIIGKYL